MIANAENVSTTTSPQTKMSVSTMDLSQILTRVSLSHFTSTISPFFLTHSGSLDSSSQSTVGTISDEISRKSDLTTSMAYRDTTSSTGSFSIDLTSNHDLMKSSSISYYDSSSIFGGTDSYSTSHSDTQLSSARSYDSSSISGTSSSDLGDTKYTSASGSSLYSDNTHSTVASLESSESRGSHPDSSKSEIASITYSDQESLQTLSSSILSSRTSSSSHIPRTSAQPTTTTAITSSSSQFTSAEVGTLPTDNTIRSTRSAVAQEIKTYYHTVFKSNSAYTVLVTSTMYSTQGVVAPVSDTVTTTSPADGNQAGQLNNSGSGTPTSTKVAVGLAVPLGLIALLLLLLGVIVFMRKHMTSRKDQKSVSPVSNDFFAEKNSPIEQNSDSSRHNFRRMSATAYLF